MPSTLEQPSSSAVELHREAGKLKHDRMIRITTMVVGTLGALLIGLVLNEAVIFVEFVQQGNLIVILGVIMIIYILTQNNRLNGLEELLGWQSEREESKMNPIAKFLDKLFEPRRS